MEACLFDVQSLVKTIQSLQLSKANKKNGEGQFLTCMISTQGIKLSNSTLSKDVYCCSWLRKNIFKKYVYEADQTNCSRFEICLGTILNCIQVFGLDAKMVILTYDHVSLHLSITDDDGAVTDCSLCTYNVSEETDELYYSNFIDCKNVAIFDLDYVTMFPIILKELLKDLCDVGRSESKIKIEFHPINQEQTCILSFSCSVEGKECIWEFSDDHNVFTRCRIVQSHHYFYSLKSLSQLEKSLNVCSLLRIVIGNNGLLNLQMAIKNDSQNVAIGGTCNSNIEKRNSECDEKKYQQIFNTEFIILPVNYIQEEDYNYQINNSDFKL
ncbi:Rad1/Rec1/Rad17 [Cryptosporidium meleagridis]